MTKTTISALEWREKLTIGYRSVNLQVHLQTCISSSNDALLDATLSLWEPTVALSWTEDYKRETHIKSNKRAVE